MTKKILLVINICFLLTISNYAQGIFEYESDFDVVFSVFDDSNNIKTKISAPSEFDVSSPEAVAQSYFFAFDNNWLKKLYLNPENAITRDDAHYSVLERTSTEDVKVILLHKMHYLFEREEMCYIMFIAQIEGIDFPFPTLLSLVKKNDNWYIFNRPNQQYLTKNLFSLKPCFITKLIENSKSNNDLHFNQLLANVVTDNMLDFNKLYKETEKWNSDSRERNQYTIAENAICPFDIYPQKVINKIMLSGTYQNVKIVKYNDEELEKNIDLINKVKATNDSISLKERIDIQYNNQSYSTLKYYIINKNTAKKQLVFKRLDNTSISDKPISDFIYLFEKLDSKIFYDLSSKTDNNTPKDDLLFQKTRGNYNVLNISKLYDLYVSNPRDFDDYVEFY